MAIVIEVNVRAGKERDVLNNVKNILKKNSSTIESIFALQEKSDIYFVSNGNIDETIITIKEIRKINGVLGIDTMIATVESFTVENQPYANSAFIILTIQPGNDDEVRSSIEKFKYDGVIVNSFSFCYKNFTNDAIISLTYKDQKDLLNFIQSIRSNIKGIVDTEFLLLDYQSFGDNPLTFLVPDKK